MPFGGLLLKITNYPFAFFPLFLISSFSESSELTCETTCYMDLILPLLPWLALFGLFGTFLISVDPVGRIFIYVTRNRSIERNSEKRLGIDLNYVKSAFNTNGINFEKDKIVNLWYFLFTLSAIFLVMLVSILPIPFENLCDIDCTKPLVVLLFPIGMLCVSIVLSNKLKIFQDYVDIATVYLFAVNSTDVRQHTKDSLSKSIEMGDWEMAERWRKTVLDDIKYRRGRKDVVLKAINAVFKPLYQHTRRLQDNSLNILDILDSPDWKTIEIQGYSLLIIDKTLHIEIKSFYDKIKQHRESISDFQNNITSIVEQTTKQIFSGLNMHHPMFSTHGKEIWSYVLYDRKSLEGRFNFPDIQFTHVRGNGTTIIKQDDPKHEEFIHKLHSNFYKDLNLLNLKNSYDEIIEQNKKLQAKLKEEIDIEKYI